MHRNIIMNEGICHVLILIMMEIDILCTGLHSDALPPQDPSSGACYARMIHFANFMPYVASQTPLQSHSTTARAL